MDLNSPRAARRPIYSSERVPLAQSPEMTGQVWSGETATPLASGIERDTKTKVTTSSFMSKAPPSDSGSGPPTGPISRNSPGIRTCLSMWWQESVAALMLIASVFATFATLYPYHEKPLPEWPYAITIGALLSVYTVVMRICASFLLSQGLAQLKWHWFDKSKAGRPLHDLVLHDDATRGVVGAMRLLYRMPLPSTWQWLGCILVAVILLVGPFVQQVLLYSQCTVPTGPDGGSAHIPRATLFIGQGIHEGAAQQTLTAFEQESISAGIYTTGTGIGATCSSGNCTFDPYSSIGYCARCDDASSLVQITNENTTTDGRYWQVNTTSRLPGGLSMSYMYSESGLPSTLAQFATSSGLDVLFGLPYKPFDPATGSAPAECNSTTSGQKSWRCQGYGAATCRMDPCIRTYQARFVNGDFQETIIDTETLEFGLGKLLGSGRYVLAALNTTCLAPSQRGVLRNLHYPVDGGNPFIAYNMSGGPNATPAAANESATFDSALIESGCLYFSDYFFANGLSNFMAGSSEGNLTGKKATYSTSINYFTGPPLLQAVYNYGNFSLERTQAVFNNISLSLTNYMRLNPGLFDQSQLLTPTSSPAANSNNTIDLTKSLAPAAGQATTMKTCLHVRWAWLSLPVAVSLLTLIYFVGVLFTSGSLPLNARSWKSSVLPLLFNPLLSTDAADTHAAYAKSQYIDELDNVAKRTPVKLERGADGSLTLRKRDGRVVVHPEAADV